MRIEFHPDAEAEFVEEAAYLEAQVSGLGERFINEVERAIQLLEEHSEVGALVDDTFRRLVLRRFPLSFIYAVEPERVFVVAVAHQRRRPGYWHSRKNDQ